MHAQPQPPVLLEVVERGRFPAAARRLNLTQPAISLQIRKFERHFGVQLIERLGKQAHATVPGREFVKAAQRLPRARSRDHASQNENNAEHPQRRSGASSTAIPRIAVLAPPVQTA